MDFDAWFIWSFDDAGLVTRVEVFLDRDSALEAAGLLGVAPSHRPRGSTSSSTLGQAIRPDAPVCRKSTTARTSRSRDWRGNTG